MKNSKIFNKLIATATFASILAAGLPKIANSLEANSLKVCRQSSNDNNYRISFIHGGETVRVVGEKDDGNKLHRGSVKTALKNNYGFSDADAEEVKQALMPYDIPLSSTPICSTESATSQATEVVDSPDTITLTGTIRDFKDDHPDFESTTGNDRNLVTTELGADKKPVYAHGSKGTRTTTNKTSFDQWYRDVSGVNKKTQHSIELTKQPDGTYKYQNNQFFPINGQLWGNYKDGKNYHFTYEIHNKFTYRGGEVFTFSGDDDVWVYIDGKRVIDIGGVHLSQTDSVSLDSLGLTIGETYDLDFFFAERHYSHSNFTITTSIQLEEALDPNADEDGDGIPNILEGFETEVDSDEDGIDDYLDEDSDNNGIPDSVEVGTVADPSDSDGDGTPNFQDNDDDDNGILDVDEIGDDPNYPTNTDGVDLPDYQDTDDDNDGISDVIEGMVDSPLDGDDIPNHHDTDSDGDGIPDSVETSEDSPLDDDTDPNFLDLDSDGDTIPDSVETDEDSELDDDTDPNFLDLDSDGDDIPDQNEEIADSNDDGDTDENLDENEATNNVDGDDKDNYLDEDSDNDGLDDNIDPEPYVYTYSD